MSICGFTKKLKVKKLLLSVRIIFVCNTFFVLLLLLASLVPYMDLRKLPFLVFLSLTVPALEIINLVFLCYWIYLKKKQLLFSLISLLIAYVTLGSFYKIGTTEVYKDVVPDLKIMSFNVRGFNKTGQLKRGGVFEDILNLINKENPDIICFQEFDYLKRKEFHNYPYRQLIDNYKKGKSVVCIYSKFPIVNSSSIDFRESANGAAFADVLIKMDTIRIYNVHLESLRLPHHANGISSELSDGLYSRLSDSFQSQIEQARIIKEHKGANSLKTIVCGDFNNTQFSNVYHLIKEGMHDSYIEKGVGFGRTYNFLRLPLRIDFILADGAFEVMFHKNFHDRLSDHYPVMASFRMKSD